MSILQGKNTYINKLVDIYKQGLYKIKSRIVIHGVTSFETLDFYM